MNLKRLISLVISLGFLVFLYSKIPFANIIPVFLDASMVWLVASLAMVVPLTAVTAWRLCLLMPRQHPLKFLESNRLILLASVLNMVLPSKMGDVAKAGFMARKGHLPGSLAVSLVVFEKACDMLSLLLWCVLGLLVYPTKDALFWLMTAGTAAGLLGLGLLVGSRRFAAWFFHAAERLAPGKVRQKITRLHESWIEMHGYFWKDRANLARIVFVSIGIWFLHLVQIWMFTVAIRESVPFMANLALAPLGILAGLLPLTFAGVGTRDAALVLLYAPYMPEAAGAALGVLCTMRYFLPALAGLPFVGHELAEFTARRKATSQAS